MKNQSWKRVRFFAYADDYRPVKFPPPGPYWCTGYGSAGSVIVAYVKSVADVKRFWPEAHDINVQEEDAQIEFSERFPKPEWWVENGARE